MIRYYLKKENAMRCVAMKTKIVKFRTTPTQLHMKYQLWDLPVDRMRCEKYYCEEWQREKNWGSLYTTRNILRCRLLSNFPALTSLCCWLRWQRLLTTLWRTARTIEGGGEVLTQRRKRMPRIRQIQTDEEIRSDGIENGVSIFFVHIQEANKL